MKIFSRLFYKAFLLLFVAPLAVSCLDENGNTDTQPEFNVIEIVDITEDQLAVTSSLPAYVSPYNYTGFGNALVSRLTNRVAEITDENMFDVSTIVVHNSKLLDEDEDLLGNIITHLLMGKNLVIVEPTLEGFYEFSEMITYLYMFIASTDEGKEMFDSLDIIPGIRQTFEAFYEISEDPEKLNDMFIINTDSKGVFADALAIRGCNFHIVERINSTSETENYTENVEKETGKVTLVEEDDLVQLQPSSVEITPFTYGAFADVLVEWVNEQEDYIDQVESMRQRSLNLLNTRSDSEKFTLDEICTAQKVEYTMKGAVPDPWYNLHLPVTVNLDICSVYVPQHNCDYYCVNKTITSYNQKLYCGPEDPDLWFTSPAYGGYFPLGPFEVWLDVKFYGPFMRNLSGLSICHDDSEDYADSQGDMVILSDTDKIKSVNGVEVVKYAPQNSIGSIDQSSGFSYGFDGGLYICADPSVSLGMSVSYDASTSQTIDNIEIKASTVDGCAQWDYIGNNMPVGSAGFTVSHTLAPKILTQQLEVDQSWIWKVPNPAGSYRIYDKTSVTTTVHSILDLYVYTDDRYTNLITDKAVSFRMAPPPRAEQEWSMLVSPYSEELNSMLASTHPKYWKADNHERSLPDTDDDSRITIEQFINDFRKELENKKKSWQSRGFYGPYNFTFYLTEDPDETYEFTFSVE